MIVQASASVPASIGAPDDEAEPEEDDDAPEELEEAVAPEDDPEELDDETEPEEDPESVVSGPGNSLPPHAPTALALIPMTTMA